MEEATPATGGSKPVFNVKAKGAGGYVGSGWVNEGKYGRYISVSLRQPVASGGTIYLYPRKGSEETTEV